MPGPIPFPRGHTPPYEERMGVTPQLPVRTEWGYQPPPHRDSSIVSTCTRRAVCLLRSRRRTSFFSIKNYFLQDLSVRSLLVIFLQVARNTGDVYIDAKNQEVANWMRFVNCSESPDTANLAAFQYKNKVYYWTCKEIQAGDELLAWYSDLYAQELGLLPKESVDTTGTLKVYHRAASFGVLSDICSSIKGSVQAGSSLNHSSVLKI